MSRANANGPRFSGPRRFWTLQEVAMVRRLYRRMPVGVIAATLGRSRRAVSQRASLLGLARPQRHATDQDRETITRMAAEGACNHGAWSLRRTG